MAVSLIPPGPQFLSFSQPLSLSMGPVHQAASPAGELAAREQMHAICCSIHQTPQDTQPSLPKQKGGSIVGFMAGPSLCSSISF